MLRDVTLKMANEVVWEDGKVTCEGLSYCLHLSDGGQEIVEERNLEVKCVFTEETFAALRNLSEPGRVISLISALFNSPGNSKSKTVRNEVEYLWKHIDMDGSGALWEAELFEVYRGCLEIRDRKFLKFAFSDIIGSKSWKRMEWDDYSLRRLFLNWIDISEIGIEALFDTLRILRKQGVVRRQVIIESIFLKLFDPGFEHDESVYNAFLKCATSNDFASLIGNVSDMLLGRRDDETLFILLSKCSASVRNRRYVFSGICARASENGDWVELIERYIDEFKPDIHEQNNRAIRWSLQSGGLKIVKLLARKGADISLSLSHVKGWRDTPQNSAVDYAEKVEALHKILKKRKSLRVSKYHLYYDTPGCIEAANKLNADFKTIHAIYESAQSQRPRRRL